MVEPCKTNAQLFYRWRELLAERLDEAIIKLSSILGVRGLVIGGSVGRKEPWPMSDIDILPIIATGSSADAEIERCQSSLVDWWAASGRAQCLDVGWLRFTDQEVEQAISSSATDIADKMSDRRWFHGLDKSYGGWGAADPDGLAQEFAMWVKKVRFDPAIIAARVKQWWVQVDEAKGQALKAMGAGDRVAATIAVREAARALRLVLIEGWGERLGSMGREWTRFERMAQAHNAGALANRIAMIADAHPKDALQRAKTTPLWLQARIYFTFAARQEVGEKVTEEESARDQIAAFAVHVSRGHPQPWGEWIRIPTPEIENKLAELDELIATIDR